MMNPRYEVDLISRALFDEFNEPGRKVGKLFRRDNALNLFKRYIESLPEPELISAEDLAWADSCLVAGPKSPLENWIVFKEALLNNTANFAASYDENNAAGIDEDGEQMEIDKQPEIANGEDRDLGDDTTSWKVEITGSTEKVLESRDSLFKRWDILEEDGDLGDDTRSWKVEITGSTEKEFERWDLLEEENDCELSTELNWLDLDGHGS